MIPASPPLLMSHDKSEGGSNSPKRAWLVLTKELLENQVLRHKISYNRDTYKEIIMTMIFHIYNFWYKIIMYNTNWDILDLIYRFFIHVQFDILNFNQSLFSYIDY